jgi:LCP family protein required for cell wall assembly
MRQAVPIPRTGRDAHQPHDAMTDSRTPSGHDRPYRTYHSSRRAPRMATDEAGFDELGADAPFADEERRRGPTAAPRPSRRRRGRRRLHGWRLALLVFTCLVLIALLAAGLWAFFAWRTVDKAVSLANARVKSTTRAQLTPDDGSLFSHPTTILVLGVDKRTNDPGRSDSIMLLRSNPATHTFSQLSIARDMRVAVPGHGVGKINTGYFWGGPALAIRTVRGFTGIPINHVVIVNFLGFKEVIDAVGGVDIYVPRTISSLYTGGRTVTFTKGWNHMDGERAIVYARIRKLDNDFYRQARQQQVMQALQKKLTTFSNLSRLPGITAQLMKGVSTDLTATQLVELAWRKWRADSTHSYILKGTPALIDGQSYIVSDRAANLKMIRQFLAG